MSFDTVNHVLWPFDREPDTLEQCECCKKYIVDPIEIDGHSFCDKCGSDYSWLRNEGYVTSAKQRTNEL